MVFFMTQSLDRNMVNSHQRLVQVVGAVLSASSGTCDSFSPDNTAFVFRWSGFIAACIYYFDLFGSLSALSCTHIPFNLNRESASSQVIS